MSTNDTVIREGEATLRVSADWRAIIERIDAGAVAGLVEQTYAAVSLVGADARREWYREVDKQTGESGQIRATWREDGARVLFELGNDDDRKDGKTGKPLLLYVHRPGPLSQRSRRATEAEKEQQRAAGQRVTGWTKYPNPKASDGRYLVVELIRKPGREASRKLTAGLGRAIVDAIRASKRRPRGNSA